MNVYGFDERIDFIRNTVSEDVLGTIENAIMRREQLIASNYENLLQHYDYEKWFSFQKKTSKIL